MSNQEVLDEVKVVRRELERGLTQVELAERVGVARVTISYLETGKRQPSMALLHRLAKALRVKVAELLE